MSQCFLQLKERTLKKQVCFKALLKLSTELLCLMEAEANSITLEQMPQKIYLRK